MDNVPEVPTHNRPATVRGGQGDVQGVRPPLFPDNPRREIRTNQMQRRLGYLDDFDARLHLTVQRPNPIRR
ncbi:MAG: hypothetical protein QG656_1465, partial [Candidatus Hydrogenedentes bacterium]|nr:hypothetical protein [Candidatus Hydrogenedentota bacterium]